MVRFLHFTTQLLFSTGVWLPQRPVDFFFLLSAEILFVGDHVVRVIVIKAAKRLCWHLLLISHTIFLYCH